MLFKGSLGYFLSSSSFHVWFFPDFSFSFAFPFLLGSLSQLLLFSYMLSIMAESSYFILYCQIWKLHNPSIGSSFNLIQGCFKSPSMEKLSILMKILIQFLNYWLHRHTLCMCSCVQVYVVLNAQHTDVVYP